MSTQDTKNGATEVSEQRVPEIKDPVKIRCIGTGKIGGLQSAIEEMEPVKEKPPVDVLMAVYNTEPTHINACLHSIRRQNYPNINKILICDDGSTDPATKRYLKKLAKDDRYVILRHKKNKGCSAAYNTLFSQVSEDVEWACLVGSDDMLSYEFVNACMFVAKKDIMGVGTFCVVTDDDFKPIRKWPVMGSPVYNMRIFREYDIWFNEEIDKWVDEELYQRVRAATKSEYCFRVVREFLYYYRFHGDNITGRVRELEELKKGKQAYETSRKMAVVTLNPHHESTAKRLAKIMKATYVPPQGELLDFTSVYFVGFPDPGLANLFPQLKSADKFVIVHFFPEDMDALDYHPEVAKRIMLNTDVRFAHSKEAKKGCLDRKVETKLLTLNLVDNEDQMFIFRQRFFYLAFGVRQNMMAIREKWLA